MFGSYSDQQGRSAVIHCSTNLTVMTFSLQDEIDRCKVAIEDEEKAQWMATSWETLIKARKESVGLQLEAAYRQRIQDAFNQVNYSHYRPFNNDNHTTVNRY